MQQKAVLIFRETGQAGELGQMELDESSDLNSV